MKKIVYQRQIPVESFSLPNGEIVVTREAYLISSLKTQLSSTDYKIIKCSEAQLLGEELPYDISSLHTERQALRDKINELEAKLEAELELSSESNIENNQEGGAI